MQATTISFHIQLLLSQRQEAIALSTALLGHQKINFGFIDWRDIRFLFDQIIYLITTTDLCFSIVFTQQPELLFIGVLDTFIEWEF